MHGCYKHALLESQVPMAEQCRAIWNWAEAKTSGAEGELSAELQRLFSIEVGSTVPTPRNTSL